MWKDFDDSLSRDYKQSKLRLLTSFDEDNCLFIAIRTAPHAIRECLAPGKNPSFFVIFLPSDSSVANFAVANHADPSLRGDLAPIQLFHPIYKIPRSDVHVRRDKIYDFRQEVITSSGYYTKFGRPSWFVREEEQPYWKLVNCARYKLNGGRQIGETLDDDMLLE